MSQGWHRGVLVAFDTETTGIDIETDRIVTAAIWRLDGTTGKTQQRSWLADPGVAIPEQATKVHGITTEQAQANGRPAKECIAEIAEALAAAVGEGLAVVAYNAAYDLSLLDREMRRHHLSMDFTGALRVIDPMVIDKQADPYRKGSRKLTDVCAHHGVSFDGAAHGCDADALAAARLAWRLAAANPELAAMDLATLHTAQQRWRAEQAASLQAYLRRNDPLAVVEGDWPLIPTT